MLLAMEGGDHVTKAWAGRTVVCIASGPSVTREDLEIIRRARESDAVRVIVVNDMYLVAPWADVLYFADGRWGKWKEEGEEKVWPWVRLTAEQVSKAFAGFAGQRCTIAHGADTYKAPGVFALKNVGHDKLSEDPKGICTGSNSGYQALNIAFLSGAKLVLLVGYDMRFQGGRAHSHNGHRLKYPEDVYLKFAKNFKSTVPQFAQHGVGVVNCTPGSAIDCFARGTLSEELCGALTA